MRLTLVRHCEVEEKYIGCYNGHIDIGLSKNGYIQAKKLSEKLKDENYDAVFCSDLKRAKESIKYFENLDNITFTDKLREKSWGINEGKSYNYICKTQNITYESFEQWIDELGGEDINLFKKRVEKFFFKYLPSLEFKNILIITHSGVIKTFFSIFKNITLEDTFCEKIDYADYKIVFFESQKQ
ncbi:MAG: histidine phosphatase family protein [Thiovulaceae bacterium]|nr:histidine phosphatase family protein [Sulfurimonadaceae bacterium]